MNFEEMCNSTNESLRKKTKAQLLTALEGKYSYASQKSRLESCERELALAKAPSLELKKLLCGITNQAPAPISDYDKRLDYDSLDLAELVGDLIAKYNELLTK